MTDIGSLNHPQIIHSAERTPPTVSSGNELPDFKELQSIIRRSGLLQRAPKYYAAKITVTSSAFILGWIAFVMIGDSWWQAATAVYLAFWCMQIGLLIHDVGHLQVSRRRKFNAVFGYAYANVMLGISAGWWLDYHNRHHAHPNHLSEDPAQSGRPINFANQDGRKKSALLAIGRA